MRLRNRHSRGRIVWVGLLFAGIAHAAVPTTQEALNRIGKWDGTTASAELARPYEDPLQQEVPFGSRSHFLAPWRAYMDTWPARHYLRTPGLTFNGVNGREADAVAEVLATAGIRQVRLEVNWGELSYDDPSRFQRDDELRKRLRGLRKHGIRPLILLNANAGAPCPRTSRKGVLRQSAKAGDTVLHLDNIENIRLHYTGLRGQAYPVAFPLITAVDTAAKSVTLSAPLVKPIEAGPIELVTLKYHPFGGTVFEDGSPNPAAQETVEGWMEFVRAATNLVRSEMGTENDAGFDIEVWNEYTFGSQFLEDKFYYEPDRKFSQPLKYTHHGRTRSGHEIILAMTVDYVNGPENKLPGVKVISGFANQRPWDNGTEMWPGQAGFSRHYYTGLRPLGEFGGVDGLLTPGNERNRNQPYINALGNVEGQKIEGRQEIDPATVFIPTLSVSLPEAWHFGTKTEFITRDVQPFPGPFHMHGRYTHPGDGRHAEVWMTEFNTWRWLWAEQLVKEHGVDRTSPEFIALMHHLGAKTLLRSFLFHNHKGLSRITIYNGKEKDAGFAVIPERFFAVLAEEKYELTDRVRAEIGKQLEVLTRIDTIMRSGEDLDAARAIHVSRLVEHQPRLVFEGDGTPAHPSQYHRDDFAVLPYQLDADRYVVGYYVVTRNLTHVWDESKGVLDPARYAMPDQQFDITFTNLRGQGARVQVQDPMTGQAVPAEILNGTGDSITIRVQATDYPRLLVIQSDKPGPQIDAPRLVLQVEERAAFSARFPTAVRGKLTWGPLPRRSGDGEMEFTAIGDKTFAIPNLKPNAGVRITIEQDGLTATWPQWDHDTAGVRWPGILPREEGKIAKVARLPMLPFIGRPESYQSALPAGMTWQADALGQSMETEGMQISLRQVKYEDEDVLEALPTLSASDNLRVERFDWNGVPAWRLELRLDPTAHPGEKQLVRRYFVAPLRGGTLLLTFNTPPGLSAKQNTLLKAIVDGMVFAR